MKKALIIATVSGFVPQFEMNNVRILQELGYEVHYASNFKNPHYGSDNRRLKGTGIVCHQVDFVRSPFRLLQNIRAYRQLCCLMRGLPFALIHCHTPMGGVLGRLSAEKIRKMNKKKRKPKWHLLGESTYGLPARVIYTAHGFHFYKGAPLFNWLVYYPVECVLSRITDTLITINEEDYRRAGKFHLRNLEGRKKQVFQVHGVGVDLKAWRGILADREKNREELKLRKEDFVLLSVGELSKRKNHKVVISAIADIVANKDGLQMMPQRKEIENTESQGRWRYLIAGDGPMRKNLKELAHRKGMDGRIDLLGYRSDIPKLLAVADCFVFPSKQEGMPVALLEISPVIPV